MGINSNYSLFNSVNFMKSLYGNSGVGGISGKYNYAARNTAKLQSIIESRTAYEKSQNQQLTDFRSNSKEFYSGYFSKMDDLKDSASRLRNTSVTSTLSPMGYGSNNSKAVSDVSGTLDSRDPVSVQVSQLATANTSTFAAVSATEKGDFSGKGSISLTIGSQMKNIDVDLKAGMTNEDALKQIASSINEAKAGVTAKVVTTDGKSTLSIATEKTGELAPSVSIKTSGSLSGLGAMTETKGQNAVYSVNGKEYTSESNKVSLFDGKLSATLTGEGTATLSKQTVDSDVVLKAVKDFASDYNSVVDYLSKNANKSYAISNLASSFKDVKYVASALAPIGVNVDGSGKISINEDSFKAAMNENPDKVRSLLGSSGGLAGDTYQKVNSAIMNSSKLIQMPNSLNRNYFYGSSIGMLLDTKG